MSQMYDNPLPALEDDPLFLERLGVFLEKSLDDMREFARREGCDFGQIRKKAAEWHSKYLFDPKASSDDTGNATSVKAKVNGITQTVSALLESLLEVSGHHSLVLVVDPADSEDDGFLGGSVTGREYWRGLRNGGSTGARNFKEYCRKSLDSGLSSQYTRRTETAAGASRQTPAVTLKNNLYVEMRSRLRAVSGVRNAEMKWTRPRKLSAYGVALLGWPPEIEYKNPSKMSFQENSTIMRLLREGTIRFYPLQELPGACAPVISGGATQGADDMSWAFDADALDSGVQTPGIAQPLLREG
ncbi:hypothetical protein M0805_008380 [Coniferiporia weirii]|nr:hypothetical protein M0805_008380 [Coniferiporia weirii]